jgi:hypothetical protein
VLHLSLPGGNTTEQYHTYATLQQCQNIGHHAIIAWRSVENGSATYECKHDATPVANSKIWLLLSVADKAIVNPNGPVFLTEYDCLQGRDRAAHPPAYFCAKYERSPFINYTLDEPKEE